MAKMNNTGTDALTQLPIRELGAGIYKISHHHLPVVGVRMILVADEKGKICRGEIRLLGKSREMRLVESQTMRLVFVVAIDIITIDVVLITMKDDAFIGIVDTPIGHFHFSGRYLHECKGQ